MNNCVQYKYSILCIQFEDLQCLVKDEHFCGIEILHLDGWAMALVHANQKAKKSVENKYFML